MNGRRSDQGCSAFSMSTISVLMRFGLDLIAFYLFFMAVTVEVCVVSPVRLHHRNRLN